MVRSKVVMLASVSLSLLLLLASAGGVSRPSGGATAAVGLRADAVTATGSATTVGLPACLSTSTCYRPAQLASAYHLGPLDRINAMGAGATIALVESFGSPTISNDLTVFDQQFGIPAPPALRIIAPAGAIPKWGSNRDMLGWAAETTLDVEWAHAMAPRAKLLLVETPVSETEGTQGFPQMITAINYVLKNNLADVISMSFGATEATIPASAFPWLHQVMINASQHQVTMIASSGDTGATDYMFNQVDLYPRRVVSWPASDFRVTAVGGTYLKLTSTGVRRTADVVWHDYAGVSGGGVSAVFSRPAFQSGVAARVGTKRGVPDISMSAAVDPGGVVWYHSYRGEVAGWDVVGGTSESAPLFAGLVARAVGLARHRLGWINPWLYHLAANPAHNGIVDVTRGNTTFGPFVNTDGRTRTVLGWSATTGYDLASGLGTVDAALFVPALAAKP